MTIRKLLLVPADTLVEQGRDASGLFPAAFKRMKRLFRPTTSYDGELAFYSDLPFVLGSENVFVFGRYYPHFFSPKIPAACPYPTCHGIPAQRFVGAGELERVLAEVDAVLVSTRGGARRDMVPPLARKKNVPVALFDFQDHVSIFADPTTARRDLYRGFVRGRDFDVYFKKDLPRGYAEDTLLPMAPVPVRPESYTFPMAAVQDVDVFYSGRPRKRGQADRGELVTLLREHFPGAVVLDHQTGKTFISYGEYLSFLARSKLALSPSGKVWDSFRHAETGLAPETGLIIPQPCIETVGPDVVDGENAVVYETEFRDGQNHVARPGELVDKLKYYLANPEARARLAARWKGDVLEGHTTKARARQLVEALANAL